ncbi:MAG TPA: ATP-binding protein [Kofleriaceae bacterium]
MPRTMRSVACFELGASCSLRFGQAPRELTAHRRAKADTFLMRLSIAKKLVGLSVLLVSVLVVVLTTYFSSRQIHEIHDRVRHAAETYSHLMAHQLESSIAFHDVETAREVLDSLQIDEDVESAVVFTAHGDVLYAIGTPDAAISNLVASTTDQRGVVSGDGSIIAIAPIVSPEGPHGTIAVELSTARASASQRTVTWIAIAVGGVAVGIGIFAAWLIARSLVRRLHRLSTAAAKVSAGELDGAHLADDSHDELGTLARAFDRMVGQLRELFESIRQRTTELSDTNEQLVQEISERSKIELELRHAQKLESIGRLASGIAHELNTPLQFVNDSCCFLRDAMDELLQLHRRSSAIVHSIHSGAVPNHEALPALQAARVSADADYLEEEIPAAIQLATSGLERMAKIVKSMKEFSHPGDERSLADVNRGLLNTLVIARTEYKDVADLRTELAELPRIHCQISELNQVFLNLIVNAAHAIADRVNGTTQRGEIVVRSWFDTDSIHISISDTGGGIRESIRDRIFDPFFTTKEVGRGTGQGLAIARTIIDRHRGKLHFDTTIGVGTTFTIVLPVGAASASASPALEPPPDAAASVGRLLSS